MSSYLRHLAERSLGVQPSVKPRLPTRYEPADVSGAGLIETEVTEIAAAAADTPERPHAPEQRRPSKPPASPTKPPVRERPVERVDIIPDSVDPAPVRAKRQREVPPAAPEPEKQPLIQEIVEQIHHITAVRPGQPPEPHPATAELSREEPLPGETIIRPRQAAVSDRQAASPRRPFSPSTTPRSNGSANTETEPALRPALEPAPVIALRQSPDAAGPEPAAPTIQVTIGRIEVRAAPPPEKAARRRSTRPVMSLDEYMRKRREGGGE